MRVTSVQTTFASGEIDPNLGAQTNLRAYNEGARRLRNFARLATGGVESRPPTLDLAALPGSARLIDYEFSSTQRYVIALVNEGALIFDVNGGLLETITGAFWTEAILFELSYSANADVIIITHNQLWQKIRRTAADAFALEAVAFDAAPGGLKTYQPYFKFADDDVALTPDGITGTIGIEASADVFVAQHVGARFRIFDCEVEIDVVTDAQTAEASVLNKLEGKLDLDALRSKKGSGEVEVLHPFHGLETGATINLDGANDLGTDADGANGIDAANLTGTFTVSVVDELRYTITASAADTAAESEDGGGPNIVFRPEDTTVRDWREPSIGAVRGYPATCCFHDGRLWFAGTPNQPDGYFGSNALKPFKFDVGRGYDGDSVQGAGGFENLSQFTHLISNGGLQVFTPTGEGVFVTRPGEPITPDNKRIDVVGNNGSGFIMPQVFDGATLFVQENGLSLSEMALGDGGWSVTTVSTLATHFFQRSVVDLAVSAGSTSRAEQYAFMPVGAAGESDDNVEEGDVVVFHSMRAENVAGFVLWRLGRGKVRSICGVGPHIFLAVELEDEHRLYKLYPGVPWQFDGAIMHTAEEATREWTLDARLRGRTVSLYSNRGYLGPVDVPEDGEITLSLDATLLVGGDPWLATLETLTPRVEIPGGARDRFAKRIVRVVVAFRRTYSAYCDGTALLIRAIGDDPTVAVQPFSGDYEFRILGISRSPTVLIEQTEPMFMRVLGMTLEVAA